jgi:hypothetical protein
LLLFYQLQSRLTDSDPLFFGNDPIDRRIEVMIRDGVLVVLLVEKST